MNTTPSKSKIQRIPADRCHLYGLKSPHALAKRLGWDLDKLLALSISGGYRVYVHKLTGRTIQEPGNALQSLHRQLHKYLSRIEVPDYLHSAVKGRSYVSNASAHIGDGRLIKTDIAKFYQSVPKHKVMHFFRDGLACAPDVAGLLAKLICFEGKLATGSSVSPIISYFAFKSMFDAIQAIADKHGLVMTCYVDDITLSGEGASGSVLHEVRTTIFRAGLRSHKDRTFLKGNAKLVTGVIVRQAGIELPFSRWKKIRSEMRGISACAGRTDRLVRYPSLVSRLYEAAQIEASCRPLALYHHEEWRVLKRAAEEHAKLTDKLKLAA